MSIYGHTERLKIQNHSRNKVWGSRKTMEVYLPQTCFVIEILEALERVKL